MIPSLTNSAVSNPQPAPGPQSSALPGASGLDPLASEQTFLKLLVAQLKNQDPMQPQDGTQFVAQLATFSSVEQQLQMRQDLDSIKSSIATLVSESGSSSPPTAGTTGQNTQISSKAPSSQS
jgi:flagellar basal-body rod modification protein FlgD